MDIFHEIKKMQGSFMAACIFSMLTLVMTSCGPDSDHYALEGHLLNMNQGEFLIYSPDGAINRVDTAYVEGGRFEVEGECDREGTLMIIMPNGAQIPVFIKPGASVSLNGNAQDLKNVEIKGLDENKLMTRFRKKTSGLSLSQIPEKVEEFVSASPESRVGIYLIRHYLLEIDKPDYTRAVKLVELMRKANSEDESLEMLEMNVKDLQSTDVGASLPDLHLVDVDGKSISDASLHRGLCVFATVAQYDYESTNQVHRIANTLEDCNKTAKVIAISIDASKEQSKRLISSEKDDFIIVCDEKMTESPVAQKLIATQIGTVIVVKNGKIIQRSLTGDKLYKYLETL